MRVIDVLASTLGLVLLSPLFFVVAVVIKLSSAGPVFYRAVRVGRDGNPLRLYKFRSMIADADKGGPRITLAGDDRITRVGRFLRKTKLDELPQLINVMSGDMALVGPRPEDPHYVVSYTPQQRQVLSVRPGITSPASLLYHDESALLAGDDYERRYVQEILPRKLAIETEYIARRNVLTDLSIILKTIATVLRPSNGKSDRVQ